MTNSDYPGPLLVMVLLYWTYCCWKHLWTSYFEFHIHSEGYVVGISLWRACIIYRGYILWISVYIHLIHKKILFNFIVLVWIIISPHQPIWSCKLVWIILWVDHILNCTHHRFLLTQNIQMYSSTGGWGNRRGEFNESR